MSKGNYHSLIGVEGLYILDTASWRTEKPVMNKEKCIECGICLTFCPVCSIEGTSDKIYYINYDNCKGCGICAKECPHKAIDMISEREGGDK
ncbi:4Fe-4S binding protein [Sedimentibacter sp.]|uniref:4Fe-4S binding protein n=1 Tax=Sedimentibacter sp. TaxID=1960295 RepID=UPI00289CCF57|nr:4Fe-4S binding protein [Sedimentibacter sp.]